jgi:hypothetical protein
VAGVGDREGRSTGPTHTIDTRSHDEGWLIAPEASARAMLGRLAGDATGEIWTVPVSAHPTEGGTA